MTPTELQTLAELAAMERLRKVIEGYDAGETSYITRVYQPDPAGPFIGSYEQDKITAVRLALHLTPARLAAIAEMEGERDHARAELAEGLELNNEMKRMLDEACDRQEAAEADLERLNQMLRSHGYGQGQIDSYAAECEAREAAEAAVEKLQGENSALVKQWNDIDKRNEQRHREWSAQLTALAAERDKWKSAAEKSGGAE